MMGKAEEVEHGNTCTLIIFPDDVRIISPVVDSYSSNSDPSSYSLQLQALLNANHFTFNWTCKIVSLCPS